MAVACKCDVCGKLYEEYNTESLSSGKKPNIIEFINGQHLWNGLATRFVSRYELCPDCMAAILACIEKLKGEKEI